MQFYFLKINIFLIGKIFPLFSLEISFSMEIKYRSKILRNIFYNCILFYVCLQIYIVQGHEPAAFLNLFSGRMVVHSGKKSEKKCEKRRLYICRGTLETETFLIEIPCSTRQLRSKGSFILLDIENEKLYVWHGNNSLRHIREVYFL